MRLFVSLTLLALAAMVAEARTLVHDLGTVREDGGTVTHRFILPPLGHSYAITSVRPGCPCLHVTYPRQAVGPRQRLAVDVTLDPKGQNRAFRRETYLRRSDGGRDTLALTGTVMMTRSMVDKTKYPRDRGMGLRTRIETLDLGTLRPGQTKEFTINLLNDYQVGLQLDMDVTGPDANLIDIPAGMLVKPMSEAAFRIKVSVPADAKPHTVKATLIPTVNAQQPDPIEVVGKIL